MKSIDIIAKISHKSSSEKEDCQKGQEN